MTIKQPIRAGRPGRAWPRIGLVAIGILALSLEGCASLGIGNGCGGSPCAPTGLRSRLANCNLAQKLFHRRPSAIAVDSCDPTLGVNTFEGMDGGVVVPGPVLTTPPIDSEPNILPNDSLSPTGTSTKPTGGTSTGSLKPTYQTLQSQTRGEAREARREVAKPLARDPLADLPALSIPPAEDAAPETSPPTPPSAGDRSSAGATSLLPALEAPSMGSAGLAPGIRRFKVIEPQLSAGSLPNEVGWTWLVNLGYRTAIDLREASEVQASEVAEINHHGLRYLSVPSSLTSIDSDRLKQFEDLISQDAMRPIFVFDTDGVRPASMAYLHLVLNKQTERGLAERKVEELGASESALWQATKTYAATHPDSTETTHSASQDELNLPRDEPSSDTGASRVGMVSPSRDDEPVNMPATTSTQSILEGLKGVLMMGVRAPANLSAEATQTTSSPDVSGE